VAFEPPFAQHFKKWRQPWNYASDTETIERLGRAGFTDVSCWPQPRTVVPDDLREFSTTVCLVRHLDPLPPELRGPFIDEVVRRYGKPELHYVRLNMTAQSI
jgi:hypothetical protein